MSMRSEASDSIDIYIWVIERESLYNHLDPFNVQYYLWKVTQRHFSTALELMLFGDKIHALSIGQPGHDDNVFISTDEMQAYMKCNELNVKEYKRFITAVKGPDLGYTE